MMDKNSDFLFFRFSHYVMEREEMDRLPVFTEEGITFVFVKCANLYLMATTKRNSNVLLMFTFLYQLVSV